MKLRKNKKQYEAMGFVEALIAIMVVGTASVVLMDIAARTMQNVVQNETIDTMTQLAVAGGEMAQEIANREVETGTNLFPDSGGYCYIVQDNGSGNFAFEDIDNDGIPDAYSLDTRTEYVSNAVVNNYDSYFRVVCIDASYNPTTDNYIVATVIVGLVTGEGQYTRGFQVSDYEYLTAINL